MILHEAFLIQIPREPRRVIDLLMRIAIKPASMARPSELDAALHNPNLPFFIREQDLEPAQDLTMRETGAPLRLGDYVHSGPCVLCAKPAVTWTPCGVLFDPEDAEIIEGRPLCVRCKDIEIETLYEKIALRVSPPSVWDRLDTFDI